MASEAQGTGQVSTARGGEAGRTPRAFSLRICPMPLTTEQKGNSQRLFCDTWLSVGTQSIMSTSLVSDHFLSHLC